MCAKREHSVSDQWLAMDTQRNLVEKNWKDWSETFYSITTVETSLTMAELISKFTVKKVHPRGPGVV